MLVPYEGLEVERVAGEAFVMMTTRAIVPGIVTSLGMPFESEAYAASTLDRIRVAIDARPR